MKRFFLLISLFVFVVQSCTSQTVEGDAPKSIPEFTFYTLKGNQPFSRTSLALKGNSVFVFFDPGCSHCRNDIKAMGENYDKIKSSNFYLVSQQDGMLVTEFMSTYGKGLQNKANVTVLLDRNFEFLAKFKPDQYPAMYVYGQDRKLKAFLSGGNPIEKIIKNVNL